MKKILLCDEIHKQLKSASVLADRTIPCLASLLIKEGLSRLNAGEIEVPEVDSEDNPESN